MTLDFIGVGGRGGKVGGGLAVGEGFTGTIPLNQLAL